jgi:glycerol uptake facilitator-like aquaporin
LAEEVAAAAAVVARVVGAAVAAVQHRGRACTWTSCDGHAKRWIQAQITEETSSEIRNTCVGAIVAFEVTALFCISASGRTHSTIACT